MDGADFLIAVSRRFAGCGNQSTAFQLFDMAGKGSVGNAQAGSQFVHAHIIIVQQNIENFNSHIRAKSLENIETIAKRSNV